LLLLLSIEPLLTTREIKWLLQQSAVIAVELLLLMMALARIGDIMNPLFLASNLLLLFLAAAVCDACI